MARTTLTAQTPGSAGHTPTYAAANADGHQFRNSGRSILHVKNGGGGSINVTILTPGSADGNAVADKVVAVPAGQERMISLKNRGVYQQADGWTLVDFSGVTTVTVGLFEGGAA
jgi:hypothetical protein